MYRIHGALLVFCASKYVKYSECGGELQQTPLYELPTERLHVLEVDVATMTQQDIKVLAIQFSKSTALKQLRLLAHSASVRDLDRILCSLKSLQKLSHFELYLARSKIESVNRISQTISGLRGLTHITVDISSTQVTAAAELIQAIFQHRQLASFSLNLSNVRPCTLPSRPE